MTTTQTPNTSKTKPNQNKARFRLPFMPSGQERDRVCCTAPRAHIGNTLCDIQ